MQEELYQACLNNDLDTIDSLIQQGVDINHEYKAYGNATPLYVGVQSDHIDVVELLLAQDSLSIFHRVNVKAFNLAIKKHKIDMAELMIEYGMDILARCIYEKSHLSPLYVAAIHGVHEVVDMLIKKGAPVDVEIRFSTPLRTFTYPLMNIVCRGSCVRVVELFLKAGANVNSVSVDMAPLHCAATVISKACMNHWDVDLSIVKMLLKHGGDLNYNDKVSGTPLHVLLRGCHYTPKDAIELFLPSDFNHLNVNGRGHLVLDDACVNDNIIAVKLLYGKWKATQQSLNLSFQKEDVNLDEVSLDYLFLHNLPGVVGTLPQRILDACAKGDTKVASAAIKELNNVKYYYPGNLPLHSCIVLSKAFDTRLQNPPPHIISLMVANNKAEFSKSRVLCCLIIAIHTHAYSMSEKLFSSYTDFDVNTLDSNGVSLLHHAAMASNMPVIAHLLGAADETGAVHPNLGTFLHIAYKQKILNLVDIRGMNLNQIAFKGRPLLHIAVMDNDIHAVNILVFYGVDLKVTDYLGDTALHSICKTKNPNRTIFELLLNSPYYCSSADQNGNTALDILCQKGNLEFVRLLVKKSRCIRDDVPNNLSLWEGTQKRGKKETLGFLHKHKVYNAIRHPGGVNFIEIATSLKNGATLRKMITNGIDINIRVITKCQAGTRRNASLLLLAACADNKVVVDILLDSDDLDVHNPENADALSFFVLKSDMKYVQKMIERGFDVNCLESSVGGFTSTGLADIKFPLHYASSGAMAKLLLDAGANPNALSMMTKRTALQEVYNDCKMEPSNEYIELVTVLLDGGANPDIILNDGYPIISDAILHMRKKMSNLVMKYANNNVRSRRYLKMDRALDARRGETPLEFGLRFGNSTTVPGLLSHGAKVNLCDGKENSALMSAAIGRNLDAVKTLIKNKAVIDAQNIDGDTAIMLACRKFDIDIVTILLKAGASCAPTDKGETLLSIAFEIKSADIPPYLMSQKSYMSQMDYNSKMVALHAMCRSDNYSKLVLPFIREHQLEFCAVDSNSLTPLHTALSNKCSETAGELITLGLDQHCKDFLWKNDRSMLHSFVHSFLNGQVNI